LVEEVDPLARTFDIEDHSLNASSRFDLVETGGMPKQGALVPYPGGIDKK
jgi:hypothetical protein